MFMTVCIPIHWFILDLHCLYFFNFVVYDVTGALLCKHMYVEIQYNTMQIICRDTALVSISLHVVLYTDFCRIVAYCVAAEIHRITLRHFDYVLHHNAYIIIV